MGRAGQGQCSRGGLPTKHINSAAGGGRRVDGKGSVAGESAVPKGLVQGLVGAPQWRAGSGRLELG